MSDENSVGVQREEEEEAGTSLSYPLSVWQVAGSALLLLMVPVGLTLAWRRDPAGVHHLLELMQRAHPVWLLAGCLGQFIHFTGYAQLFGSCLRLTGETGPGTRLWHLLPRTLVWAAADRIAPMAGMGGTAAFTTLLATDPEPVRLSPARALPAIGIAYALDYAVFASLALLTVGFLAAGGRLTRQEALAVGLFCALVMVGIGMVCGLARVRSWKFLAALRETFATIRKRPEALLGPLAGCLQREAADAFALYCACRASGAALRPEVALAVYILSNVLALITFVPQGIGVSEVAAAVLLQRFGVPAETALAGALLYRGISFWLPIPFGLLAGVGLRVLRTGRQTARQEDDGKQSAVREGE